MNAQQHNAAGGILADCWERLWTQVAELQGILDEELDTAAEESNYGLPDIPSHPIRKAGKRLHKVVEELLEEEKQCLSEIAEADHAPLTAKMAQSLRKTHPQLQQRVMNGVAMLELGPDPTLNWKEVAGIFDGLVESLRSYEQESRALRAAVQSDRD